MRARPASRVALAVATLLALGMGPSPTAAEEPAEAPNDAPVEPDSLVVPEPEAPAARNPGEDINKLLRAEFSILEALQELEMNTARRTGELERLERQEQVVEDDLGEMAARFDRLTAEVDTARALVQRRLRAMIQLKRTEPYQVLFASDTYERFLRRERALAALLEVDRHRIAGYREQLDAWRKSRDDLERRRTNLLRTRQDITHTLQQLNWDREEKAALLDAVQERRAFFTKVDQEMETIDQDLREKVDELGDPDRSRLWIEENKGKLMRPIWKGKTIGRFGVRTHRGFDTRTVHRGIDIVPTGWSNDRVVKVRSIYWGYVAYVGWMRGLGRTVIVDHTRGYMSLYAHLDQTAVEVGEKVKTGGQIGTMGDTASLHGKRLYLELRKNGQAVDPSPWIR